MAPKNEPSIALVAAAPAPAISLFTPRSFLRPFSSSDLAAGVAGGSPPPPPPAARGGLGRTGHGWPRGRSGTGRSGTGGHGLLGHGSCSTSRSGNDGPGR